jgi:hypothetical protein
MLKNNFVGKLQAFVSWLLTNFNQSKSFVFYGQNCYGQKSDICLHWLGFTSSRPRFSSNLSKKKINFVKFKLFDLQLSGLNAFKYLKKMTKN